MNAAFFCSRASIFLCGHTHDERGGEDEWLSGEGRKHVDDTGEYKKTDQGKEKAEAITVQLNGRIEELQECLYANGTRSVLITRVHGLVSDKVVTQRFKQIKEFEELLYESGTTMLKFFLHISKEEQKERLG